MSESLIPLPFIESEVGEADVCPHIEGMVASVVGRFRNWEIKHADYDIACYLLTYGTIPKFRYTCYRKVGDSFEGFVSFKESKSLKALGRDMFPFVVYPNVEPVSYLQWIQSCSDFVEVGSKPCFTLAEKSKRGGEGAKRVWKEYADYKKKVLLEESEKKIALDV